jgi:anti-sigma-K factor RskA
MNVDSHSLVGAYAVDALDDVERAAFDAHLADCAMCRAELTSLRAAAAELSSLTEATPPARLKDAVLGEIRTVRPLPPVPAPAPVSLAERRRRSRPVTWLLVAAAAAVLAVGGLVWSPWDNGPPRLTAVERVLQAPDAQRVERQVGSATATIVRSKSLGQAVIVADHIGAAPTGKDYQVWFQDNAGAMHPAGLMPHSSAERVSVLLRGDAAAATGVGITLEPAGGSPKPTSAPLVLFPLA